jgi:hypothetical protein
LIFKFWYKVNTWCDRLIETCSVWEKYYELELCQTECVVLFV